MLATARLALRVLSAAVDPDRPLITHLVITRRCNLSCTYCFEYDKVSPPVPYDVLCERIDHLARLRSIFVTLTGGESLLHPDCARLVAHVRARGMTPFVNTNAYLLTRKWIDAFNDAGLRGMQISIDNVRPNAQSKKSLELVLPKLRLLAAHAKFTVRINTVLGSGPPEEAVEVTRAALALGFDTNCSLVRDGTGAARALDAGARRAYAEILAMGKRAHLGLADDFTLPLLETGAVDWKCRAGARTFMVCERGLVHLCQPRMGEGAKPLADYGVDDIRRAFDTPKPCAATCPIAYAHQASKLDRWRTQSLSQACTRPVAAGAR